MESLIERLDRWLATNRPDYYAHLRPGVTDAPLDAFEARFGLQLPAAFCLLYRWRDGQDAICSASFQDNLIFSPLVTISSRKDELDGIIGSDFEDPRWWRHSWVPYLENGAGDHVCLDLAAEDGGTHGQLLTFYHDWERRPIRFPSIEAWLEDLVASMEGGWHKVV